MRYLIIFCLLIFACSKKEKKSLDDSLFESQQSVGKVGKKLQEASGLVASIANPGYLWTHNDGNNRSEIYLIDEKANVVMTCNLKEIANRDWEDITIGPGPEEGVNYIYVADIGDNEAVYPYKILYRFAEPQFTVKKIEIEKVDTLVIQLSDGQRDSETIMVDPMTSYFYVVSKREHAVRLYEIKFPFVNDTLQAENIGTLPFSSIVSADISADGSEVLMKNYQKIFYWRREGNESLLALLQRKPSRINYQPEPQGEAIAWKYDGTGFYTLSESEKGEGGELYFYKRK